MTGSRCRVSPSSSPVVGTRTRTPVITGCSGSQPRRAVPRYAARCRATVRRVNELVMSCHQSMERSYQIRQTTDSVSTFSKHSLSSSFLWNGITYAWKLDSKMTVYVWQVELFHLDILTCPSDFPFVKKLPRHNRCC